MEPTTPLPVLFIAVNDVDGGFIMATVGTNYLTIADHVKRLDPDGKTARIVEILNKTNELLSDIAVLEGNLPTGHRTTMRSGLPSVTWRKLYGYTSPSKSTVVQVDDSAGILEAFAFVDEDLAKLNGDVAAFRLSEDNPFFEAMNQEFMQTYFYGNTDTDPEEFLGLAPRFSVLSTTAGNSGTQIIDGSGTGSDNTSMWLLKHGEQYLHSFFPKGSEIGLTHRDMGLVTETDSTGAKRVGYQTQYKWKVGLSVRDYRHIVRIANLDISDLKTAAAATDTSADLINLMIEAMHLKMENLSGGKLVWYCGREVFTALTKKAVAKANVNLTFEDFGGPNKVMAFQGIPIKRVDALTTTESRVT